MEGFKTTFSSSKEVVEQLETSAVPQLNEQPSEDCINDDFSSGNETSEDKLELKVKQFVDVGTQTEPLTDSPLVSDSPVVSNSPVVDRVMTPGSRTRVVELDHAYSRTKLEFCPQNCQNITPSVEPEAVDPDESDSSDEEWDNDF